MTAIYLIAAGVAVVWLAILMLRGSLVGGCLLYLVVASCFGYEFAHFKVGPVPLTLDRIALAILLAAFVVQRCLRRQVSPLAPREGAFAERKATMLPVDWLLAALVGLLAVSTLWGDEPATAWTIALRLVGGYLLPAVLYFVARQAPLDRGKVSMIQAALVALGVYLGVTGVLEVTGQWWAVFPRHIADPAIGLHWGRARGPMVHSVSFGMYLGTCLLAAWAWQWRFGRRGRLVLVLLMALMLPAIFFSYTRSVWLGTALGLFLVLAATLRGAWRPLVLGTLVAAGLLVGATRTQGLMGFDRELPASYAQKSVELRGEVAYISWKMFLDRPLLGFGFDQFPQARLPYLADRDTELNLEATRPYSHHATVLSLLTETGLVGLGLFLALLGCWAWKGWRVARDATLPDWARAQGALLLGCLGVYLCQALFHELSYQAINNSLLFFLAGVTVGLHRQPAAATSGALTFRNAGDSFSNALAP